MTKKGDVAPKRFLSRPNKNAGKGKSNHPALKELSDEKKIAAEIHYELEQDRLSLGEGQPTKVSLKELKLIEYLCKRGQPLTYIHEQISILREQNGEPEVSYDTFVSYKKRFPEYFRKIEDWQAEADKRVVASLYAAANGEDGRRGGPSVDAQKFILTNRMPNEWKERRIVELGDLKEKSDEELKQILASVGIVLTDETVPPKENKK